MGISNSTTMDIQEQKGEKFGTFFRKYGIILIFITMLVVMSILSPSFLNPMNLLNVVRQVSMIGIIAMGVTFCIISTGIDLSSGSVLALAGVVAASLVTGGKTPALVGVLGALAVGAVCGSISGALVAKGRIPAFIATLGMMTGARGLALLYTNGRPIGNLSDSYQDIGGGWFLGLPIPILIFVLAGLVSHFLLAKSRFGKHVYAVGGNVQAARVCGINVQKTLFLIYMYAGFLTGLAGVILSSRIGAGQPNAGVSYELDAIASTVIGGTSLAGGVGSIPYCIIGALIIGVLNNGLDLLNVSTYWQQILKGVIIISAVLIDVRKQKTQ